MTIKIVRVASLFVAVTALLERPVQAQNLADDAKCLLVSGLFAKSSDARAKQAGDEARLFYLGRLNGSPAQVESAIRAQTKAITPQNAGAIMQACTQAVADRANQVKAIGQRLRNEDAP